MYSGDLMKNGLIITGASGFVGINCLLKINNSYMQKYEKIASLKDRYQFQL